MKISPGNVVRVQAVLDCVPADPPLPSADRSRSAFRRMTAKKQP